MAAIRSESGASKSLVSSVLSGKFELLLSTPLLLEYEAVLIRADHLAASGLSAAEVEELLDAICIFGTEVAGAWSWRPQLRDPNDEMVLETAINGHADAIVNFNRADFSDVCRDFGIAFLAPREALKRISPLSERATSHCASNLPSMRRQETWPKRKALH